MGYDCYMVFVNTSLKVAKQRNKERTRRLPEDILVKSWKDVQKNLGAFQSLFGSNFVIVDNSKFLKPEEAMKKFGRLTNIYNALYDVRVEAVRSNYEEGELFTYLKYKYSNGTGLRRNVWSQFI